MLGLVARVCYNQLCPYTFAESFWVSLGSHDFLVAVYIYIYKLSHC
jgi:hypothetical protein